LLFSSKIGTADIVMVLQSEKDAHKVGELRLFTVL